MELLSQIVELETKRCSFQIKNKNKKFNTTCDSPKNNLIKKVYSNGMSDIFYVKVKIFLKSIFF